MYKVVRTALPLLFIVAVYSGGPFYDVFGWGTNWPTWGVLLLFIGIANILCAYFDRGYRSPRRLAFWDLVLKLCMIPFYTLLFLYATGIATIMFVIPGLFLAAPFVVVPLLAISYLLMLATSSYGFGFTSRGTTRANPRPLRGNPHYAALLRRRGLLFRRCPLPAAAQSGQGAHSQRRGLGRHPTPASRRRTMTK